MTTKTNINKTNAQGFTLIELLVVIGILAILLAITLIAINPARQFGQANDTKRRSDATEILNAIGQYGADPVNSGQLPADITGLTAGAATELDSAHFPTLCSKLVTTYISALPVDPATTGNTAPNGTSGIVNCDASTNPWDTGYKITRDTSNRITVSAPQAYAGATAISVTR